MRQSGERQQAESKRHEKHSDDDPGLAEWPPCPLIHRQVARVFPGRYVVEMFIPATSIQGFDPTGNTQFHYDDEPDGREPTVTR